MGNNQNRSTVKLTTPLYWLFTAKVKSGYEKKCVVHITKVLKEYDQEASFQLYKVCGNTDLLGYIECSRPEDTVDMHIRLAKCFYITNCYLNVYSPWGLSDDLLLGSFNFNIYDNYRYTAFSKLNAAAGLKVTPCAGVILTP
ncbi:MAG: hypothetical protein ABIH66_06310 [bacterium]